MPEKHVDVAVIGSGPGGYVAAIRAAQIGLTTVCIDRDRAGGICTNWGCIPTKALLKNAEVYHTVKHAADFGVGTGDVTIDFPKIIKRSRDVALRNSKGVEYLLKKNKVEFISGTAAITGKGAISISQGGNITDTVKAKHIIVATGARARTLPNLPINRKQVITYAEAMSLPERPASIIIIGAGAIGVEFAYFYQTLGTKVTLIEMMPNILPIEDREISRLLEGILKKSGIDILTESKVETLTTGKSVTINVTRKDGNKEISADCALVAIGVQGNSENLGLEALGVKIEKGWIQADDFGRTNVAGIYAIGDVAGPPWLAHVASREALVCVDAIAGRNPQPIDWSSIPGCTYCQPQVASIGMTEEQATAAGHQLKIGRFPFSASGKARAIGETDGLVKLIFDARYGELLGAHILGSDATEMLAELGLAKKLESTANEIIGAIHAHPTLSEAVMEAAEAAYGHSIHI